MSTDSQNPRALARGAVKHSENAFNRGTWLGDSDPRNYTQHKTGKYQAQVKGKYIGLFATIAEARSSALAHAEGAMP